MRTAFTVFSGIFLVMALSNAIVPVLPAYADSSSLQGAVYAAYFLGAFASTLPAGMLSDRSGRAPLIRSGLIITAASGLLLCMTLEPYPVLAARFIEGIGSGCFVAAALAYVNSRPDHEKMSGYFMALMNAGLVTGLVLAGWLAERMADPAAGILLFFFLLLVPSFAGLFLREPFYRPARSDPAVLIAFLSEYRWLLLSSVILIGITGVVSALYPGHTGASPDRLGFWIAGMSVATIGAVLAVSRVSLSPVPAIRLSAVLMAAGVILTYYSPWGFAVLGALAGVVMVAQILALARAGEKQGIAMGLFATASYLGMAALPFFAGIVADAAGFFLAFCLTAISAMLVAATIGRSPVSDSTR